MEGDGKGVCDLKLKIVDDKEERIKNGLTLLFILWNYSFTQGVFHFNSVKITNLLVLRGDEKVKKKMQELLSRDNQAIVLLDLSDKAKVMERKLENVNEAFVLLDCKNIDRASERRAGENFKRIRKIVLSEDLEKENQRIFPILWIESMIPKALDIQSEDIILLDMKNFDALVAEEISPFGRLDYVGNAIRFVEANYAVIANDINRKKDLALGEVWAGLKIIADIVAFIGAGKNYGDEYENIRAHYTAAIDCVQDYQENSIEIGDILEIFRMQLGMYFKNHALVRCKRDSLINFESVNDETVIFEDNHYMYFRRTLLENVCYGELRQIPFLRVLQQLEEEGFLKVSSSKKDKTVVVNLICPGTGESQQKRLIALRKDFIQ